MIQRLKDWLYELFTASNILIHLLPFIKHLLFRIWGSSPYNWKVVDEGGATIKSVKYKDTLFPRFGLKTIAGIKSLRIRRDDIMLCGYPKTGHHWVQEILHMLVTGKLEMTKHGKEFSGFIEMFPAIYIDSLPSPRVLNTHIRYGELPEQVKARKTKIVVTVRSPKDTVVSYYNHKMALSHFYHYNGSFDNYFKLFISGQLDYGDYFDYVLDWDQVMRTQTDNPIFLVEYEKLKTNAVEIVKELAQFLNIDITDDFARKIVEVTDFSNMKAKNSGDKLYRKGQVGDWHNWLTVDQSAQIDQVWKERMSNCTYQAQLS